MDQESLDKETKGVEYFKRGDQPSSYAALPVYDNFGPNKGIAGFLFAVVPWDLYFRNILSNRASGIIVEVEETCGSVFAYMINGDEATYIGQGHVRMKPEFRKLVHASDFAGFARFTGAADLDYLQFCNYRISVYPTIAYKENFTSEEPVLFAVGVALIFCFTSAVFVLYDFMVTRRQNKVMATATKTSAIVASLFPQNVQERIFKEAEAQTKNEFGNSQKKKLKAFLSSSGEDLEQVGSGVENKPIADLFTDVTIMFADVSSSGFCSKIAGRRHPLNIPLIYEDCWFHCVEFYTRTMPSIYSSRNYLFRVRQDGKTNGCFQGIRCWRLVF